MAENNVESKEPALVVEQSKPFSVTFVIIPGNPPSVQILPIIPSTEEEIDGIQKHKGTKSEKVECKVCQKRLTKGYIKKHLERIHDGDDGLATDLGGIP